jgi:hypothetical protein
VKKRVTEGGNNNEMDKTEWDNVGKFLRDVYSTGDDMKFLAASIGSAENKKRALNDIDDLRKYAQAGDIPVSKQDAAGYLIVSEKMEALVNDFFAALTDVPAEL